MMKRLIFLLLLLMVLIFSSNAQSTNIIILGDLHHDSLIYHDKVRLSNEPDFLRQVNEYTNFTSKFWKSFMDVLRKKVLSIDAPASLMISLGDLNEGVAESSEKTRQMAAYTMEAVNKAQIPVPWIIVKGNHDFNGPGGKEAFSEFFLPMIRKQTGNINRTNYSYRLNNVQIICLDPWDSSVDVVDFLEKELTESCATVKIIALHQPVIPVTERCWHLFKDDPEKREKLLDVIARHKAIVLCAHLHRYSVVKRNTISGPIVQIMTISVVNDSTYINPDKLITQYGPSLVDSVPSWDPPTTEERKKCLLEESKYVTYYKQTVLPGYSLLKIDKEGKNIVLEYYAAFGRKPYDVVNISELMK